jgi:hypothetical protein
MTWIEEIQQIGANLVAEFRRIADESEAQLEAAEKARSQNSQTAIETRIPPSAL